MCPISRMCRTCSATAEGITKKFCPLVRAGVMLYKRQSSFVLFNKSILFNTHKKICYYYNIHYMQNKLIKILILTILLIILWGGCPGIIEEVQMEASAAGSISVHVAEIATKIQTCQTTPACVAACALCGGCGAHDQLLYTIKFGQEARSELIRGCPSIGFKPMQGTGMCNVGEVIFGMAQDSITGKITPADANKFFCGVQK